MADALKAEGNKLFAAKDFQGSIEKFTQAIELEPSNHVLYSNRSGSYASLKDFDNALKDADKVVEIKPDWPKGYTRKAAAHHGKGDLLEANDAYEEALKIDPNNAQAKSGLQSVQRAIEQDAGQPAGSAGNMGLGNMFGPDTISKLANNPKTAHLLGDPDFMNKLRMVQANPNLAMQYLGDQRFMQALGVMMGIDISSGPPGSADAKAAAAQAGREYEEDVDMPDARPASAKPETKKVPEPEPVPEPEDEEEVAKREAKAKADEEKKLGTDNYKKRQFDAAIEHYQKAWDLHKDITYLTNLGAAYFEKGDYKNCIEACQKAVDEGREVYADFKLIAKAYGRIGIAYEKQGDLANAVNFYQRSLTEHRTPDVLNKLRAAEKAKIVSEKNAYIDPEKAEEARELGNQKFKALDWPAAVEAYTEMIKRAPDDARGYSNRAACLIKLIAMPSAIQDCDEAIKRDSKFIRAYLRKAQALFAMKEYNKCLDVCDEARQRDEGRKNEKEISGQEQKALEAQLKSHEGETEEQTSARIQKDPEILAILQDPVMNSILQQAKGDPAALSEHMAKSPQIRRNVQKLMAAGVIRTR